MIRHWPTTVSLTPRPLKRRQFMSCALASALTACALTQKHQSTSASDQSLSDSHVLVIGAGVAGLAAAQHLGNHGATVTILEAQDRIGGRLWTDRSLGLAFEIGAGWIHGPQGNPITPLAHEAGATTYVTDDNSLQVFSKTGEPVETSRLRQLDSDFRNLVDAVDEYMDENDETSLAIALQNVDRSALNDELIQWALSAFTEFSTGGPLEKLSASHYDEDKAFDGAQISFCPMVTMPF